MYLIRTWCMACYSSLFLLSIDIMLLVLERYEQCIFWCIIISYNYELIILSSCLAFVLIYPQCSCKSRNIWKPFPPPSLLALDSFILMCYSTRETDTINDSSAVFVEENCGSSNMDNPNHNEIMSLILVQSFTRQHKPTMVSS